MVVCPEPGLPDGALLRIRLRGLTAIDGKVVWQHRGHAGVRFVSPLHQALLEHLGFHEPAGECERNYTGAREPGATAEPRRPTGGLHAQLVKRTCLVSPESNAA